MSRGSRVTVLSVLALAGIAVAVTAAPMAGVRAQEMETNQSGEFTADIAIRHGAINENGAPPAWSAVRLMHVTRARTGSGWRLILTSRSSDRPVVESVTGVRPLDDPFEIVRTEIDEGEGAAVRMYNRRGELVRSPDFSWSGWPTSPEAHAARRAFDAQMKHIPRGGAPGMSAQWMNDTVVWADEIEPRRLAIERRYGSPRARIRGLDRFVTTAGDATHEVLVNPAAAVPVEMNTAVRGELTRHTMLTYAPIAGGLYRRNIRTEQRLPGSTQRLLTDIDLTNVALGSGRAR